MPFTKEQSEAIVAMRPLVCVSAGAGSGKTTILIERIAYLLDHPECWPAGERPGLDRIAAITFTDKAAAEMKARLRRRFREAAPDDSPERMHFWREMERQVDGARVSTIHAFCASILREHALRIGLDPDWGVLGDAEAQQLAERCTIETVHRLLEKEDASVMRLSLDLSRKQLKEVLLDMLNKRWEFEARDDGTPYKNADHLYANWRENRLAAHEAYLRLLCHNEEVRAIHEALSLLKGRCSDSTDKRELQRCACEALFRDILCCNDALVEKINAYLDQFPRMSGSKKSWEAEDYAEVGKWLKAAKDFLKEKCLLPEWQDDLEWQAAQMTCDFLWVGDQVMAAYRSARQISASLDYEDMINDTLFLLRSDPALCERVARGIRFLLIDEFQDTDERQLAIAQLLTGIEGGPQLFIVGDAKQSIYYFRGAEVDLFKRAVADSRAYTLVLADNFRSTPGVLSFVNDFFGDTGLLDAVETYRPMGIYRKPSGRPCVEYFLPESCEEKESTEEVHEREAQFVAARIYELCNGCTSLQLPERAASGTRSATYDDIVLLFRRGSHMEVYESALRKRGIPYNRIAGAGFFQRREVQDILALLKVILDPWDEEALTTFLRSPLAGLSDESLMRMALTAEGMAATFHASVIPEKFEQAEVLANARSLWEALYDQRETKPGTLIRKILDKTGYEAVLLGQHLGLQRVANLRKVVQMADNFSQSRPATLQEFTRYLDDVVYRDLREGESILQAKGMGAVTLMTIHKAKGLEFPIVVIPEMYASTKRGAGGILYHHKDFGVASKIALDDGSFAAGVFSELMKRCRQHEETMEAARILYVAMTRACDYLILCGRPQAERYSWADVLNRTYSLENYDHDGLVAGKDWQMRIKRAVPSESKDEAVRQPPPEMDLQAVAGQIAPVAAPHAEIRMFSVTRLLSLMSGSDALDGEYEVAEAGALREASGDGEADRLYAMNRGNLVHRLFECWDFASDGPPDLGMLIEEAGLGLERSKDMRQQLQRIVDHFCGSPLLPLYASASCIEKEVPFLLDIGPALVRGVVDAAVDNKLIVDYKTGAPGGALESQYETQLCIYACAMQKLKGHLPEQGILWYADYGELHTVHFNVPLIQETLDLVAAMCKS